MSRLLAPNPGAGLPHDQHEARAVVEDGVNDMGLRVIPIVVEKHQVEIALVGGFLERLFSVQSIS